MDDQARSLLSPDRRLILAGGAALLASPALVTPARASIPASNHLAFEVWRQGKKIGRHVVSFSTVGGETTARTEADMTITIGPITVFRYVYKSTERWRGGQFVNIESVTQANSDHVKVSATAGPGGVRIQSTKVGAVTLPANAVPLCHWNLEGGVRPPFFNPQDGKTLRLNASRRRETFNPPGGGRPVAGATHVILTGESPLDDWYDPSGVWIGLSGKVKDGSILEYHRA